MKKFLIFSIVSLLGLTLASILPQSASAQSSKFSRSTNGIANRYIVRLSDASVDKFASEPSVRSEADHLKSQFGGKVREVFSHAMKGFVMEMNEKAAIAMSKNSRVAMVEQDAPVYGSAVQGSATWGIDRVDQRGLPLNTEYGYNTDASNVHAYIVDSGIRTTHVEFGGRATKDYDAVGDGQNGNDCNGHGTHVAGTVGSAAWGVAKNVRLHAVRVLPCTNSGAVSDLIEGMDWIAANHIKPAVANISITASGPSSMMDAAIQNAINAGVTVVVAAGNYNLDACNYSPARGANVISVGATTSADARASYSNFGSCVDIWAPGTSITSASHASDFDARGMSGTSMASPHVTGAAALYLAANPAANPAAVAQGLYSSSTSGVLTGLGAGSPDRMVYSLLGSSASPVTPPVSGKVTIKKRAVGKSGESLTSVAFPYEATNFATSNFSLQPDNEFVDPNVKVFGSQNAITVTENQVFGWQLKSITCTEVSGSGKANAINSHTNLLARSATIVVEEGETVDCVFESEELMPSAAPVSVSGRVLSRGGKAVKGVQLSLIDATTGRARYTTTNSLGNYQFNELSVNKLYVITAQSTNKATIVNNSYTLDLTDNLTGLNFFTSNR